MEASQHHDPHPDQPRDTSTDHLSLAALERMREEARQSVERARAELERVEYLLNALKARSQVASRTDPGRGSRPPG
jgi:hypothetical protein